MKDRIEEIKGSARAQVDDAQALMLASVGSDGVLKFCILVGSALEDAACAMQCQGMAAMMEGGIAAQAAVALVGDE